MRAAKVIFRASFLAGLALLSLGAQAEELFIRASQLGYRPHDPKLAMVFGETLPESFEIVSLEKTNVVLVGKLRAIGAPSWGKISQFAELDFSKLTKPGRYAMRVGGQSSWPLEISEAVFDELGEACEHLFGVFAACLDVDRSALPGREHHDGHDAFTVGAALAGPDANTCSEAAADADELRRGACVQSQLVDDGGGDLRHVEFVGKSPQQRRAARSSHAARAAG